MSEVESAKGSGDCLPKLNYLHSDDDKATSSIVRLNGTIDSTVAEASTGKWERNLDSSTGLFLLIHF